MYTKTTSKPKKVKKQNNFDYFISTNDSLFQGDRDVNTPEDRREKFLKENMKLSKVIPHKNIKNSETPDNFGYMNTSYGFLEFWNKKYKKNSHIVVSLVPESAESSRRMSKQEVDSPQYYFGGDDNKEHKRKTISSEIAFVYDPHESEIKKLVDDGDGELDTEDELLYTDTREEYMIEKLNDQKSQENADHASIDKRIEKMKDIKEEKKEDNEEFLKIIKNFVKKMKNGKVRKKVESDEAKVRSERIVKLSLMAKLPTLSIVELRERLKDLSEKQECRQEILKLLTNFICKAKKERALYSEVHTDELKTEKEETLTESSEIDSQRVDIVELKKRLEELWKKEKYRKKLLDLITSTVNKMKEEESHKESSENKEDRKSKVDQKCN